MDSIEIINSITGVIESLGIVGMLVWWVVLERKRSNLLSDKILEDWDDMRRQRTGSE